MHIGSVKKNINSMKFQKIWSDMLAERHISLKMFCIRLSFSGTLTTNYKVLAICSSALLLYAVHVGQIPWRYRLGEFFSPMKTTKHIFNEKFRTWALHNKVKKIIHFQLYKTCSSNNLSSDTAWS